MIQVLILVHDNKCKTQSRIGLAGMAHRDRPLPLHAHIDLIRGLRSRILCTLSGATRKPHTKGKQLAKFVLLLGPVA
jgi:hypothetical protein